MHRSFAIIAIIVTTSIACATTPPDGVGGAPTCTTGSTMTDAGHAKDGNVLHICLDDAGLGYLCDGG